MYHMEWKLFKRINLGLGWLSFAIAALVYLLTIGPSASLWDCAEFIVTVRNLEIGHPPGAPFFMLVYNLATQLTSDPMKVGLICNAVSALLSALTILFLYWTIVHLVRRLVAPGARTGFTADGKPAQMTRLQAWITYASGFAGAMVYTFSDTFWFSAVEAEVYAFSSFFTALVFWLMLEWEERAADPTSDRWLILVAYFMGLGIGVHLLNLLCIPAMALIYYYKRTPKPSSKGALGAIILSFVLIVVMMYGIIQGSVKIGAAVDIFAVNSLGFGFNVGFVLYVLLLVGVLAWSAWEFYKGKNEKRSRISFLTSAVLMGVPFMTDSPIIWILCLGALVWFSLFFKKVSLRVLSVLQMSLVVIAIGFSTYGVILIRSVADTPMNENSPNNALALKKYLNREQYGERPLLYGQTFASKVIRYEQKDAVKSAAPKVTPNDPDRYVDLYKKETPVYTHQMLFPRMWSPEPNHVASYNSWVGRRESDLSQPSMVDNIKFFFSYQLNYMYWRYFAWNFIGRQNDLYGDGSNLRGGVSTGIPFIDNLALGTSEDLPDEITANKGHNVYYLLPFVLGLLGIVFQLLRGSRGVQSFWVVFFLFFMTGIAIVMYINQTPGQPRERDYAYAGSFYAFAIWIGMGIAGLYDLLKRISLPSMASAGVVTAIALLVPLQMAGQNWDDHDRSGRTVASDFGYNFLIGCEPNAIVFDFGDNDTFPLWYVQEVEGVRRDVLVSNLSYLGGEWYVDQMQQQLYDAPPMPLLYMNPNFYYKNPFAFIQEGPMMPLSSALETVNLSPGYGQAVLPSHQLLVPLDSAMLRKRYPLLTPETLPREMLIDFTGMRIAGRDKLTIIDLIGQNQWQRPIYWVRSTPINAFSNLPNYLTEDGMNWRLNPIPVVGTPYEKDVEHEYDLVMNKYRWFGASDPNIYFDENIRNTISGYYRGTLFPSLANALLAQGDTKRAKAVLEKCFKEINPKAIPYSRNELLLADACYKVGLPQRGDEIIRDVMASSMKKSRWLMNLAMGSSRCQDMFVRYYRDGVVEDTFTTARLALQVARSHGSKVADGNATALEGFIRMIYGDGAGKAPTQMPQASPAPSVGDSVQPEGESLRDTVNP